jgi:hypothetical protein
MVRAIAALAVACLALPAPAQDLNPKVFRDAPMQKGQWRIDVLEMKAEGSGGAAAPRQMTVCMDSVMEMARQREQNRQPQCSSRLVSDTADEAVVETSCDGQVFRSAIRREGARAFLVEAATSGKGATPFTMKARYTYEGACKGDGAAVTLDKSSPQCRQALAQVAAMDPAKACASAGAQRKTCEEQMRNSRADVEAMCR